MRDDSGINWEGLLLSGVKEVSTYALNQPCYTNDVIEDSPYYRSSYMCPCCETEVAQLYKMKIKPVLTKTKMSGNKDVGIWNIFTCPHCKSWFASISYIEGSLDLRDEPSMRAGIPLKQYALYSLPMSPGSWYAAFIKTLRWAK